jgi:hypothetical protein
MEPIRQIFARRRFLAALGILVASTLSACTTLEQLEQRLTLNETPAPPEAMPQQAPEPPPAQMPPHEMPKPPMEMEPRMLGKMPMMRPRPAKPSAPSEQAQPKPAPIPRVMPADLVGSDFAEVLRLIRQPDTVQTNALAIVWTYSEPVCKLQLYFYPDIETTTFHVLKYDLKDATGGKLENAGLCMQRILIAKNDAAP